MKTWNIDSVHSNIGFKITHLMVSKVRGEFTEYSGSVTAADDTFVDAQATFTAQAGSIDTRNAMRDGHLKSPEFFDVAQFPSVTFTSKSFVKEESGWKMSGDFAMHGVTKEITLDVDFNGITAGLDGKRVASFDLTGTLSRKDFGLVWNAPINTGGMALGDDVWLDMHIEAVEAA